ncbi:MAG: hypothetical protein K2X93_16000 [Candidatus Obscuribacterales bacterium]|nr:hypothetical protein [Candidatus Obscuribacterales bacterium]
MEDFQPTTNFEHTQINSSGAPSFLEAYSPENMRLFRKTESGSANSDSTKSMNSASGEMEDFLSSFILFDPSDCGHDKNQSPAPSSALEDELSHSIERPKANRSDKPEVGKGAKTAETKNDSKQEGLNPIEIQKHIENLGSREYKVRADAQKSLENMGSAALPALQKANEETEIPEVQQRAETAINTIKRRIELDNCKKYLEKATDKTIDSLLEKAGVRILCEKTLTRPGSTGEEKRFVSQYGAPKGQLTDLEKKQVEELIKMGDSLKDDDKFWLAKNMIQKIDGPDVSGGIKINKLAIISVSGRDLYARALSNSNNPADIRRGVELLTEEVKNRKSAGQEISPRVIETAARLDAGKDPNFLSAFKNAGGNPVILDNLSNKFREIKNK